MSERANWFKNGPALYTPWGQIPTNDNAQPLMIGLTGKRNVGKSTVADMLVDEHGFQKVHAFAAGKYAAAHWFNFFGLEGYDMVYGDLKDTPHPALPAGVSPRYFLERFGRFMGEDMGVDWTLGAELAAARRRHPRSPIVVESVVYEADWFSAQGGFVVRLERPGHEGPEGIESDAKQADIVADATISATSVVELRVKADALVGELLLGRRVAA